MWGRGAIGEISLSTVAATTLAAAAPVQMNAADCGTSTDNLIGIGSCWQWTVVVGAMLVLWQRPYLVG